MRKVTCAICGKEFETSAANVKYCSFSCREAATILRRMKWRDTHPGYSAEYQRKRRKEQNAERNRDTGET